MQECIMDMSFVRRFYDGYSEKYPDVQLIGTFYNYLDLLASKDNNSDNIDGRLEFLKNQAFKRLINEKIIIWEPFFEIIRENYPIVKMGRTLYKRITEDFLPYIDEIRMHGKDTRQELKNAVINYSEVNQERKRKQIIDFGKYSERYRNQILKEGNDPNDLSHWVSRVNSLLKELIWKYATNGNYLPSNFKPDMKTFSVESCELFVYVLAKYLQNSKSSLTPALNDNIDVLSLLYVRNGRKLLMRDERWVDIINELGLSKKYLQPLE